MRWLGLDVHRDFAEIAEASPGGVVRRLGRIRTTPTDLRAFAESLGAEDQVAMEAPINTFAIARLLEEHASRVVVSNPLRTRAIADAKIKTDKVDAGMLAQLLAADYLPAVWQPDGRYTGAPRPGRPPSSHRPPAEAAEEPGACHPPSQPGDWLSGDRRLRKPQPRLVAAGAVASRGAGGAGL